MVTFTVAQSGLFNPGFKLNLVETSIRNFFFLSGSVLFDKDPAPEKLHRSGGCGLATLVSWIRIFMQNLSRVRIRMRILITIFLQALSPPVCTYLLCIPRVFHLPALGILDDSSSPCFLIIFSFFFNSFCSQG